MDPETLETVPQFSRRMKVSINTVRKWIRLRVIPAYKIEDIIRVPVNRALSAIEARSVREAGEMKS
jgi:hypothetical protein